MVRNNLSQFINSVKSLQELGSRNFVSILSYNMTELMINIKLNNCTMYMMIS